MLPIETTQKKFLKPTFMAAFFMIAAYIYYPFLTPYLLDRGFTEGQISAIFSLSPFILIFSSSIIGKLSDTIGRKRILNLTLMFFIVSMVLYLYVDSSIIVLAIATILSAIGIHGYNITILQRVEDNIKKNRGFLTGIFESIKSAGGLAGPVLGTLIVSFLPVAYVFKAALFFLLILLAVNHTLKSKHHAKFDGDGLNFMKNMNKFWKEKKLRGMGMLGMAMHFALPAQTIFIPVFIMQNLGGSIRDVGIFASIYGFFHIFQFFSGKLCDKNGSKKIILASVAIFALALMSLCFIKSIYMAYLVAAIFGIAGGFWNTSAWCYMSKVGEKIKKEGMVTGSYVSIAKIGGLAGYLLSAVMLSFMEINALFIFYGAVILLATIISARYFVKRVVE